MDTIINADNATEYEVHKWSAEASDLGWIAGDWPHQIQTVLGNKMPFIAIHWGRVNDDLKWVDYRQTYGCIVLRVFND